jgi:hypothetical protein
MHQPISVLALIVPSSLHVQLVLKHPFHHMQANLAPFHVHGVEKQKPVIHLTRLLKLPVTQPVLHQHGTMATRINAALDPHAKIAWHLQY